MYTVEINGRTAPIRLLGADWIGEPIYNEWFCDPGALSGERYGVHMCGTVERKAWYEVALYDDSESTIALKQAYAQKVVDAYSDLCGAQTRYRDLTR